jgi:hypothetical protein
MKPVYDISPPDFDSIDWLQCKLIMEINEHYFLYVILRGKENLIALRYYSFPEGSHQTYYHQLQNILTSDEILQRKINDSIVIYNLPENSFLPADTFNPELGRHVIEMLHGDLKKGNILSEKLEGEGLYNVFLVPTDVHQVFESHFQNIRFWHHFSIWMKTFRDHGRSTTDLVSVIFYPNNLLVAVNKMGKLQLMQTLSYQTPDDVAYHLLTIYHQFGFSQEDMPLEIGGMVDVDSSVYEELLKYFQLVEKQTLPGGLAVSENFDAFPAHFFSPFLKQALCVS